MATSPVFDVVVVGAGIMGSSAAAYAAMAGGRVALLEQFDLLHRRGSSHGESRITRRTYPSKQYTNLMKASYRLWEEAQAAANMTSVYRKTGGIDVLRKDSETYKALVESCEANAVPIDLLTAAQLREEYGLVFDDALAAVRQADTGTLRATEAVAMYQQLAIRHGAQLRERCPVVSCVRGVAPDGTPATAVTTATGDVFHGRRVVLACGPWAGPMLKSLVGLDLPLIVWQCTVMYFKAAAAAAAEAAAGGAAAAPAAVASSKSNEDLLTSLPVLIDYGNKPLWTSTGELLLRAQAHQLLPSSCYPSVAQPCLSHPWSLLLLLLLVLVLVSLGAVDDYSAPTGEALMPSIYSCPAGEYPGLIKFAVHEGAVTTADDR